MPSRSREPRAGRAVGARGRHHRLSPGSRGGARTAHSGRCQPRRSCKLQAEGVSHDHCDCYTLFLSVIAYRYFVISRAVAETQLPSPLGEPPVLLGRPQLRGSPWCSGLGPTGGWTGGVWTPGAAEPSVQLCLSPGVPITHVVPLRRHTSWWHRCPRANHCAWSETGTGLRVSMECGVHLCVCVCVPMYVCLCVLPVHGWASRHACISVHTCVCFVCACEYM